MKEPKEVDGIFQADNPMPTWWKLVWLISIIVSIGYVVYFHWYSEWPQEVAFEKEVAEHEAQFPAKQAVVANSEDGSNPYRDDAVAIKEGEGTYKQICSACHGPTAEGAVGPSLVDKDWIHGNTDKEVFNNIMKGIGPERQKLNRGGMPAWEGLGAEKVYAVMAWLATKNSSLVKAK
ncbi:cytochrome C [Leptospira wolbachii serovar Codice str. CDC]|uniref:Cytochrome C n=1 Tax=Leptospira wolbachii serovar Codice str. CDC TaxID=1218599 RepID=R8ZYP0_9LEPT|nr:c-type cytochrome [Leptospira wolbachii]EOQ94849.1 cytochrome C [Leptospira wolbachii serovar Codice str. CDC]